jgi:adenine-specific DNA-methyltransferase
VSIALDRHQVDASASHRSADSIRLPPLRRSRTSPILVNEPRAASQIAFPTAIAMDSRQLGDPSRGVVYTKPSVVSLVFDLVDYVPSRRLSSIRVLDIGCGYGQFIVEAARRLIQSCKRSGLTNTETLTVLENSLRGIEINPVTARVSRMNLSRLVAAMLPSSHSIRLKPERIVSTGDFLELAPTPPRYDLIVGNLPYVRYDGIDSLVYPRTTGWLRSHFACFRGRADYSVAFIEQSLEVVSEKGAIALIAPNRFTQSEYGRPLRRLLSDSGMGLDEVDLGRVSPFVQEVTAYPSLFVIRQRRPASQTRFVRLLSLDIESVNAFARYGIERTKTNQFMEAFDRQPLPSDGSPLSPMPPNVTGPLVRIKERFPALGSMGLAARTGPATGADHVFIGNRAAFPLTAPTKRRYLLPVYRTGDLSPTRTACGTDSILSLFESGSRRLLGFEELPEDVRRYLTQHRHQLERRHIVSKLGRDWWSTIDKFDPALVGEPKIMIPDLRPSSAVWLDVGLFLPGHTVTYVTGPPHLLNQIIPILQSPVADLYRLWDSPSMQNGSPRATAKSVTALPIPPLDKLKPGSRARARFDDVFKAYGLSETEARKLVSFHRNRIRTS